MNKLFLLILVAMLALSVSAGKIHPNLESVNGDVRVLVQFVDHPGKAENALLKGHSCEIEYVPRHMNLIIASCPGNKLNALANESSFKKNINAAGRRYIATNPNSAATIPIPTD